MPNLSKNRQSPALLAIGNAIRRARTAHNLSQEELSLRAEVDLSYVGRIERGDNNVTLLTLIKLANALDLTLTELMAEAEL
ncbi:MAG: helix-turn-helix transcriptional regulator [Burkholderiales bacterium]|nr:helix-turn-helix transcriptional regulator [Burkholderiales bacterium]